MFSTPICADDCNAECVDAGVIVTAGLVEITAASTVVCDVLVGDMVAACSLPADAGREPDSGGCGGKPFAFSADSPAISSAGALSALSAVPPSCVSALPSPASSASAGGFAAIEAASEPASATTGVRRNRLTTFLTMAMNSWHRSTISMPAYTTAISTAITAQNMTARNQGRPIR